MRRLLHALVVATVATAVLIGSARAEVARPVAEGAQQAGLFARIAKEYGAAIRVAPSSNAPIMFHRPCGDVMPVVAMQGGWVKVVTGLGDEGWVGGGRVTVGSPPAPVDCSGARFLYTTGYASTYVPTGCLSLRTQPSREAPMIACVGNGHVYQLTNGPYDPGTGEDWFAVYSPSTGSGWALADHLYP